MAIGIEDIITEMEKQRPIFSLALGGSHTARWIDYPELGSGNAKKFRYILLEVRKPIQL